MTLRHTLILPPSLTVGMHIRPACVAHTGHLSPERHLLPDLSLNVSAGPIQKCLTVLSLARRHPRLAGIRTVVLLTNALPEWATALHPDASASYYSESGREHSTVATMNQHSVGCVPLTSRAGSPRASSTTLLHPPLLAPPPSPPTLRLHSPLPHVSTLTHRPRPCLALSPSPADDIDHPQALTYMRAALSAAARLFGCHEALDSWVLAK